jgi:hypothetical protein
MFVYERPFRKSDLDHETTEYVNAKDAFRERQTYETAERYILMTLSMLKAGLIGNDEYRHMGRSVGKFIDAFGVYTRLIAGLRSCPMNDFIVRRNGAVYLRDGLLRPQIGSVTRIGGNRGRADEWRARTMAGEECFSHLRSDALRWLLEKSLRWETGPCQEYYRTRDQGDGSASSLP